MECYWGWHMDSILKDLTYSTNEEAVCDILGELDSDVILVDEESEGLNFFELQDYRLNKAIQKLKDIHENKIVEKWLIPIWNEEYVVDDEDREYFGYVEYEPEEEESNVQ